VAPWVVHIAIALRGCVVRRLAAWMPNLAGWLAAGDELPSLLELAAEPEGEDAPDKERVITLNCRHRYHEFCIRGWMIVGKKDTCPYCNEKVDLKQTFTSPWEKTSIVWANLLDMVGTLRAYFVGRKEGRKALSYLSAHGMTCCAGILPAPKPPLTVPVSLTSDSSTNIALDGQPPQLAFALVFCVGGSSGHWSRTDP
jgi:hypothetical protein